MPMRSLSSIARSTALVVALSIVSHGVARAEDPPSVHYATPTTSAPGSHASKSSLVVPGRATQPWVKDGSWGWFVVASSIFLGTGITGFGLGQTCEDGVNACTRGTSLALWGGIGLAAVGSAIGLIIVQAGHSKDRNQNFATVNLGPLGDFRLAPPAAR